MLAHLVELSPGVTLQNGVACDIRVKLNGSLQVQQCCSNTSELKTTGLVFGRQQLAVKHSHAAWLVRVKISPEDNLPNNYPNATIMLLLSLPESQFQATLD